MRWLRLLFLFIPFSLFAQHPFKHYTEAFDLRYSSQQPVVNYTLIVDEKDLNSLAVEMHLRHAADTFRVAMLTHPEYDEKYWRQMEGLQIESPKGNAQIRRIDSALWRVKAPGGEAIIRYKIRLASLQPNQQRAAWRMYLSATGGLIGGPYTYLYVVGQTLTPSYVHLQLPNNWNVATAMQRTSQASVFFAPSIAVLMDEPMLIGQCKKWSFEVDGVPHQIAYWPLPDAVPFDTLKFVSNIQSIVQQAKNLFGRLPYREYCFLLQDGAYGALEHFNSVTLGAPGDQLAKDMTGITSELAHEYFHAWNLMRIHPVEYGDVDYRKQPLSKGLWFSEGLTMYYADLLQRRAGLPTEDSTRLTHLQSLIRRFLANPVYQKFSPETISLSAYASTGYLGDYSGSAHLAGELLGNLLDIVIRRATANRRSMDDVMRKMMEGFSGEKGFTSKDIEQAVTDVCHCHVHSFFNNHIYSSQTIDFNEYLQPMGMQLTVDWKDATNNNGQLQPDNRVYAYEDQNDGTIRMGIYYPSGNWGKAGLHTGDKIVSVNNKSLATSREFFMMARAAKIGDTVVVQVQRKNGLHKVNVVVAGYKTPTVKIEALPNATANQKQRREAWLRGE